MDHIDYDRGRIALGALQGRVRELSQRLALRLRLALPKKSHLRKLKALVFVALAVFFGTVACRLNREETALQWRRSHIPSGAIWTESFAAAGFRPVSNPLLAAKITRRLPTLADATGPVWKAAPDWWAVETGDGTQPLVFCFRCALKSPPADWNPAGEGWEGWESAMSAAKEEARSLRALMRPPKKRGEAVDPREIRY